MGNLVDRIRYGWVIDFIDVYVDPAAVELHWPTFNVADIAIVAGVLLMSKDADRRDPQGERAVARRSRRLEGLAGGDPTPPLSTEAPPPVPPLPAEGREPGGSAELMARGANARHGKSRKSRKCTCRPRKT